MRVELIAVMVGGGAVNFNAVRGTSTSVLSRAELAGMLAGLAEHEMNYALAAYARIDSAKQKFSFHLYAKTAQFCVEEGWHPRTPDFLRKIAMLVVEELVDNKKMTGCYKAEELGISETQWRKVWRARYAKICNYVNEMDCKINSKLTPPEK